MSINEVEHYVLKNRAARSRIPPLTAETRDGAVSFKLSPHLKIVDDEPEDDTGERQWRISY